MKLKVFQVQEDLLLNCIYHLRDKKVMIDEDLAMLYQVESKRINEQVKRNIERFPDDFAFYVTRAEYENLKSQIATSSCSNLHHYSTAKSFFSNNRKVVTFCNRQTKPWLRLNHPK